MRVTNLVVHVRWVQPPRIMCNTRLLHSGSVFFTTYDMSKMYFIMILCFGNYIYLYISDLEDQRNVVYNMQFTDFFYIMKLIG